MVELFWADEQSLVIVTSTYAPSIATIRGAWPRRPPNLANAQPEHFQSADHALAITLNALARRFVDTGFDVPGGTRGELRHAPLDTYVVHPRRDPDGPLDAWFSDHLGQANYRVIVHCQPSYINGKEIPYLWRQAHRDPRLQLHRDHEKRRALERATSPFASELLAAYRQERAREFMRRSGYPHTLARGGRS